MKVLITAVGGDIGQSILKLARRLPGEPELIGTDISAEQAGRYLVDSFHLLPAATDPDYGPRLGQLLRDADVDLLVPIHEGEIAYLAAYEETVVPPKCRVLRVRGRHASLCPDKYALLRFLADKDVPVPWTALASEPPLAFPCILKQRFGSGSRGLVVVPDAAEYAHHAGRSDGMIVQERLTPADEEYTCGVFRTADVATRVVVLHRRLAGGLTGYARVVAEPVIEAYCRRVAELLDLVGSFNIQLIRTPEGPRLFEINARFSSTVVFRDHVGFRDFHWSVQDALNQPVDAYDPAPGIGQRFFRVFTEFYPPMP